MRGLGRRAAPAAEPVHVRENLAEFGEQWAAANSGSVLFGPYGAYRGALKIPGAWRASTLLSGLVSQLPLEAYRDRAGVCQKVATPPLLADPCPGRYNQDTVMAAWVMDYLFDGNAIAVVAARSPLTGLPTAVLPIPASWVRVAWADGTNPVQLSGSQKIYQVGSWLGGPWDVIHVMGPSEPGALRGLGVLEAACTTLDLSRELQRQAASISAHGVPTGTLESMDPDIPTEDLVAAKADWLVAQRDRTVAAMPPGVKFTPMAWNPEELELIEARKFSLQEVSLYFGLPGRYLGVESGSLQYSTPQLDSVDLLKLTVERILRAFENEFSRHLVRGTTARFNREAILETDTKTRYETYAIALDPAKGWVTRNEVRVWEELEPLPEFELPEPPPEAPETDPNAPDDILEQDTGTEEAP